MDFLEQMLYDDVSSELYEMAWKTKYPINPAIGLWGFFEAFRKQGIAVTLNDNEKTADFNLLTTIDKFKMMHAKLSYDKILGGWNRYPKSSLGSLYDSICQVYDNMGDSLQNLKEKNKWSYFRDSQSRDVRAKMEDVIEPYFSKYQEHMLLPVSGKIPGLTNPVLFEKVIDEFPMSLMRNARLFDFHNDRGSCGPNPEYIPEIDPEEFSTDYRGYHPSENSMRDYFWGSYLLALSKEKGYPVEDRGDELKSLIMSGASALKNGERMKWNVL